MAATPRRARRLPASAPWVKTGSQGGSCPRDPLPFTVDWRQQAARAALAYEMRTERRIFTDALRATAPGSARGSEVVRACGIAAARRTVTVDLSLTAFYPSASLSERVWAVARFSGWGWRPFLLLH